jgi:very-short-patch-repair endonuclease/predicted transcriptional regulator of viral defense system
MAPTTHELDRRASRAIRNSVDNRADQAVAKLAARRWGVLSIRELRACGLTNDAVKRRVDKGTLHRLYRGVYSVGHPNPPLEGRFLAAVEACGERAVLSHLSAAALHGFVRWDGRYPEVAVEGSTTCVHRELRVHRAVELAALDVVNVRGIPTTAPARTLADLAATLEYRALRRAVRQAQSLKQVSLRDLAEVAGRLGRRRGVRNLRRIIATGPAPTRSELEDVVLDLILSAGLSRPNVNVPMRIERRVVIPDFRWPERRLVVEADGAAWHSDKVAREDDAERQALLEAYGERVLRVTWEQAVSRRHETVSRIRAAGAPTLPVAARG